MSEAEERIKPTFSVPGPGGSLGKCAMCGKSFTFEILTGQSVAMITCSWFPDQRLPMHKECADGLGENYDARLLPEGPLRTAWLESQKVAMPVVDGDAE